MMWGQNDVGRDDEGEQLGKGREELVGYLGTHHRSVGDHFAPHHFAIPRPFLIPSSPVPDPV